MDVDLYNDTYDIFCKLIEKHNARIFEIACGPGNITRYILSKRPDFKIQATDVAPNMIKLAKENIPTADFKIMDCREIDKVTEKFDGIMCGFCMPYLSKQDCAKLVKDCYSLLNDKGIFYFSVIEGDYSKSGFEHDSSGNHRTYVYYYSEEYLLNLLEENNFELLELKRKKYERANGSVSNDIIFIVEKRQAYT